MAVLALAMSACVAGSPVVSGTAPAGFAGRDLIDVGAPAPHSAEVTPRFGSPSSAAGWLADRAPTLVVTGRRTARAYPIAILMRHQIVEDVIDDRPLAVTYSPFADASAVWDRRVGGRALTLRPSGKAYRADAVLYDTETESLWPQLSGHAVRGPMKGARLSLVPSMLASFGDFRAAFPDGQVMQRPVDGLDYDLDPFVGYDRGRGPSRELFSAPVDRRLGPLQRVTGGFLGQSPFAFPSPPVGSSMTADADGSVIALSATMASPLDAAKVSAGRAISATNLFRRPAGQAAAAFSALGRPLRGAGPPLVAVPQIHAMWFAWQSFYDTRGLVG
jgi:hypothetical protein